MGAAETLRESRLRVVVSDDGLDAFVIADAEFQGNAEDLASFLRQEGLLGPADEAGQASFLALRSVGVAFRVVHGRAPRTGSASRIDFPFASLEPRPVASSSADEPFAVDHRETRALERCEPSDVLARVVEGTQAVDGVDARGRAIPAERAADVKLVAGSNAALSADGRAVVATIAGVPSRDASGRIVVNPAVTVKNVDFKTGNIHFEGSVLVEGDVLQGFSVEAGGDVEVRGCIENATVRAGGSIHVKGGVRRHSLLRAAGDVEVRFADSDCHLEARGWVRVTQNAIQCELVGDEGVAVGGQLVSGVARSWDVVEAGLLGCPHGAQTVVSVERPNCAMRVQALREELGIAPAAATPHDDDGATGRPSFIRVLGRPETQNAPAHARARETLTPRSPTRGPLPGPLSRLPPPGLLSAPGIKKALAPRPAPTGARELVKSKVTMVVERRERERLLAHAEREVGAPASSQGRVIAKLGVRPGVTLDIAHDVRSVDEELGPRTFFVNEGTIVDAPLAPAPGSSPKVGK